MTSNPAVLSSSFALLTFTDPGQPPVTCHQAPSGRVIITRRTADTTTDLNTFQVLAHAALPPADSADLIKKLAQRA